MKRTASIILSSLKDIFSHKMRAFLTSLGVVVGVISVVGIGTAAYSMQKSIEKQFSGMGADTFYIMKFSFTRFMSGDVSRSSMWDIFRRPHLELDYLKPLQEQVTAADKIAPTINYHKAAVYKDNANSRGYSITATTDKMQGIGLFEVDFGRFIIPTDVERKRSVCVIGQNLLTDMFDGRDPIGEKIKLGGIPFTVVGVLDSIDAGMGHWNDDMVIVPITTAIKHYKHGWWMQYTVKAKPGQIELAQAQTTDVLRRLRGLKFNEENNFDFMSADMLLDVIGRITGVAYFVMIAISAIALIVAGIGIMNVMYVTVSERTKEIGIRKSLGATSRDILLQFAFESVVISAFGGLIGILLVWGGVQFVPTMKGDMDITILFPPQLAVLGLVFSFLVGVTFGIAPARKAAKMNVVDALRE